MFTIFNTESIYIGTDIKRFNEIRDILDQYKIKYKYKIINRLGGSNGSGTIRGSVGSIGNRSELMYQYEIKVKKDDSEYAMYLISV